MDHYPPIKSHSSIKAERAEVAFFLPSLRGGGAERVFTNLANELVKRGIKVDLILAQKVGPYLRELNNNVNIVDLKAKRILFSLIPLINYLKTRPPNALVSSLDHVNIIAILAKAISQADTKIFIRIANTLSVSLQGTKIWKRALRLYGTMFFARFADKIISVSRHVAVDYARTARIPLNRIKVIYNPTVTLELLNAAKNENDIISEAQPIVLGVGRFHKQKDFPTLVKAFAKIREKYSAKLVILGEGEEKGALLRTIHAKGVEKDVILPGFVNNPYSYMKKATVFVLSSRWEGLPNALIEAMAVGTPVISTDCPGGSAEILENGKFGKLVKVGDVAMLAKAIDETIQNPPDPELLKNRALQFTVDKALNEYWALITETS